MPECDASIVVRRCVIDESFGDRSRVVPQSAARASIESVGVVGRGDEHYAARDDRSDFHVADIANVEDPLRFQTGYVARSDLIQSRESLAGIISVIRKPVLAGFPKHCLRSYVDRCRYDRAPLILRAADRFWSAQGQNKSA